MKQKKSVKPNRKKYLYILKRTRKIKRTRKLRDIKYDFSKIHPASIMLHRK